MTKKHFIIEEIEYLKENSFKKGVSYAASEFDVPGVTLGKSALNKFLDNSSKLKPTNIPGSDQIKKAIGAAATQAANRNMGAIRPGTVSKALTGKIGLGGIQQAAGAALKSDLARQATRQGNILKKAASDASGTLTNPANKVTYAKDLLPTSNPDIVKSVANVVNTGKGKLAGPDTITSGGKITRQLATGRATKDAVTGLISSLPAGAAGVGASRAASATAVATRGTPIGKFAQSATNNATQFATNVLKGGPKGSLSRKAAGLAVPVTGAAVTAPAAYKAASIGLPAAGDLQQKTVGMGSNVLGAMLGTNITAPAKVDTTTPATAGEMLGTLKRIGGQIGSGQTTVGSLAKTAQQAVTNTPQGRRLAAKAANDTAMGIAAPGAALATRVPGVAGAYKEAQNSALNLVAKKTSNSTKLDVGTVGKVGQAFMDARTANDASKKFNTAQGALAKFKTDSEANIRLRKSLEGVVTNAKGNYGADDIASAQKGLAKAKTDFGQMMGRKVQAGTTTSTRGFNASGSITKPVRTDVKPSLPKPRTPPKITTQAAPVTPPTETKKKGLFGALGGLFGKK